MMRPVIAHKGKHSYRCTVHGLACHSAYAPQGVNAVEAAAEAVAYLKRMARRHRDSGPLRPGFRRRAHDDADRRHPRRHRAEYRAAGMRVRFRVPAPAGRRSRTRCCAEFRQYVAANIEPEMRAVASGGGFRNRIRCRRFWRSTPAPEAEIVALAQELVGQCARSARCRSAPKARSSSARGIPAVVCGPGLDRAGAQAERVRDAGSGHAVRGIHAAVDGADL